MTERWTLSELRTRHVDEGRPLPRELEVQLRQDPRAGAHKLLEAIERRRTKNRAEGQRLRKMLRFETELWESGIERIAGVDEAGMSPLAGPVVAGAVILPRDAKIARVDDSKKLDAKTREETVIEIKARAIAWAVGIVSPEEIDRINIYRAGLLAMRRAVEGLSHAPEALLVDARKLPEIPLPQQAIIKGDTLSLSIAAASIVAKTTRDAILVELDGEYPGYGFARHKGYPVREHYEALQRLGATVVHRRSFRPVREVLGLEPEQGELFADE